MPASRFVTSIILMLVLAVTCRAEPDRRAYQTLADEVRRHFDSNVLHVWFPRCVDDKHGGFTSTFSREWKPAPRQDRFLVFQSRMTWLTSQVAMRRPELRQEYLRYARHGVAMLQKMWDGENGGLFWSLDEDGKIDPARGAQKHVYAIAFGMYAAAAAYEATHDQPALDLAMKTFDWLDDHAHDATNGGYHEALQRDGTPIIPADLSKTLDNRSPGPNVSYGYKSMNSHIHLLEALTGLYHANKNDRVRARLEEVFLIVRDKIAVEPGCLNQFFTPDWRPVPDDDSFGHDIETAYLLIEAAETLGRADEDKTLQVARHLVDHALDWGFDHKNGGFYDKGAAFERAHVTDKIWWTQAEGLNALLLMHERFRGGGQQTDRYWKAFDLSWRFVIEHTTDKEFGGWYETTDAAGKVTNPAKSHDWKAGYHDGRALMNIEERLRRLASRALKED
jgi:mannobiose 2-epimerase